MARRPEDVKPLVLWLLYISGRQLLTSKKHIIKKFIQLQVPLRTTMLRLNPSPRPNLRFILKYNLLDFLEELKSLPK